MSYCYFTKAPRYFNGERIFLMMILEQLDIYMGRKEGKIRGRKKREKQGRRQGRERGDSMRGKERGEERRKGEKSYSQSLPCTIYNNLPEVNHKLKYKS